MPNFKIFSSVKPGIAKEADARNACHTLLLDNIEKHFSVLNHRNFQLRKAMLDKSAPDIDRRYKQFVTVLHSYIRLVTMELHEAIVKAGHAPDTDKYIEIRNETFCGYAQIVEDAKLETVDMLKHGPEIARKLFNVELQLKQFQQIELESIYPLYSDHAQRMESGANT